jgi:putative hydrolases of HD superfamily
MFMNSAAIVNALLHGNQLKRTARTGWVQRGVPSPENVAAHTFGVAFAALLLAQVLDQRLALDRVLAMALLHDLPEGLTSDIPTPAWRFMPAGIKSEVERRAMVEILAGEPLAEPLLSLWEELHAARTAEARLVHDADRIDLLLQALVYEEQLGNRHLQEFWDHLAHFHFSQSREVYELLLQRRIGNRPAGDRPAE